MKYRLSTKIPHIAPHALIAFHFFAQKRARAGAREVERGDRDSVRADVAEGIAGFVVLQSAQQRRFSYLLEGEISEKRVRK